MNRETVFIKELTFHQMLRSTAEGKQRRAAGAALIQGRNILIPPVQTT